MATVDSTDDLGTLYATNIHGRIYAYNLKEIRVHSPSEHKIEGNSFDLELQEIYEIKSEFTGITINVAIISILYTTSTSGAESPLIEEFTSLTNSTNINMFELLNATLPDPLVYFAYEGSYTTPNCAEVVNWYVIQKALPMSKLQLDAFTSLWAGNQSFASGKGNNREIMNKNNRTVKKGGVQCEEQFIYFFSFVLLYAFINYFIFKLL